MTTSRLLIRNGCVLTLDQKIGDFAWADVLVEGDKIAAVGPSIEASDARIIDATDMIVIPGFVDAHRHTQQAAIRNLNSDMTFEEYFGTIMGVYSHWHRPEDVYIGNLAGALEALDVGVTTLQDWSVEINTPEHADAAVAALQEAGIRGSFGYGPPYDPLRDWWSNSILPHPEDARRVRDKYFSSENQLLSFAMALRGPEFTTPEINEHDFHLSRELNARIYLHIDAPGAIEGISHLLGPDTIYIHCCRSTDHELKMIADSGGFLCVSPECEMGLHNAPVTGRALALGLRPCLGVDSSAPISGDMFVQMRMALQQERMRFLQAAWQTGHPPAKFEVSTRDALEWATIESARAMGLEHQVGSLTPGKQADIVLLRADGLHLTPLNNPVAAVVTGAGPRDVDTVLVAGKLVKQNGKLLGVDLARIRNLLLDTRDHLYSKGGVPRTAQLMANLPRRVVS